MCRTSCHTYAVWVVSLSTAGCCLRWPSYRPIGGPNAALAFPSSNSGGGSRRDASSALSVVRLLTPGVFFRPMVKPGREAGRIPARAGGYGGSWPVAMYRWGHGKNRHIFQTDSLSEVHKFLHVEAVIGNDLVQPFRIACAYPCAVRTVSPEDVSILAMLDADFLHVPV